MTLVRAHARAASRHIGARMREARESAGLSREALASRLSIKACAVSKYERGHYRISAGLLQAMATLLGRDIAWFFSAEAACEPMPEARHG